MAADSLIRPPEAAEDWTIPQNWDAYTAEEHAVWDTLFARQAAMLPGRAAPEFLAGLDMLHLSRPGIPNFEELSEKLGRATGWHVVAVPGLVPDDVFFAMLSERVFPVGNFIRTREQLDYLEAPDCFHDMFGHIPLLAHHDYAEMTRHIGELGSAAIAADQGHKAARLYWHSVEFGLAKEHGELKILGAGLASSFGESHLSLESGEVERLPFSIERAVNTPYKHDAFQPRYLVSASLEQTIADVLALTPQGLLAL
jgi:phenylalanine-4-hydroxylase